MNDPQLFGAGFRGDSWNAWRVVLKAAFAMPLTPAELITFHELAGDRDPPTRRVRELWVVAGRRAGKDSTASLLAAHSAAFFSEQDSLRPGERASVICIANSREQAKIVLDLTRAYFKDQPLLRSLLRRDTIGGFELNNGVDVRIEANSHRSARGNTVLMGILDEVATFETIQNARPDSEVYVALKPATLTMPGSMIVGISSPYRRSGLLFEKYRDHYGVDTGDDILVIKATTSQLNPTVPQDYIAAELRRDPVGMRAELLAEFRDDISGFLDIDLIEAAVDTSVMVRPPQSGIAYHSFVDASGGVGDSFTCAICHADADGRIILDALSEQRPPFNPQGVTRAISSLLQQYGLSGTVGDHYGERWVVDEFARNGIALVHSSRPRSSLYIDCIPLFTSGRIRLLDNRRLVAQFAALERTATPSGDKIDHGRGGHDDLANVVAGAATLAAHTEAQPVPLTPPLVVVNGEFVSGVAASPQRVDATRAFYERGGYGGGNEFDMSPGPGWWKLR
jgi:hypothetical protein